MKRIFLVFGLMLCFIMGFGQQDQDVAVVAGGITPQGPPVGTPVSIKINFIADNGASLNPSENMEINVCFNKITANSKPGAVPVVDYSGSATVDFIDWIYIEDSECWKGIITQSLDGMSYAVITFNNLIVAEAATPAEADAQNGIGYTVNLKPHHRDPSGGDDRDFDYEFVATGLSNANLAITKSVNNATPTVGQNVIFTITATNNGPSNATGVVVNEPLPSGYTLVSTNTSVGSYTAPNWAIGNLANGASATMTVEATVLATGVYANTVTIDGTEPDPDPTDNTDTETPTPTSTANLAITKSVNNATPTVGQNVIFTLTATNNGPSNATGVVVNEPLPSGYTLVSTTPSTGTYTAPNWTIGNLANGASATMTVVATVNAAGSYTNTVTVDGNEPDPDPTDNTDTETPTPTNSANLAVSKVVNNPTPTVGQNVIFTITATNNGPSNATGVIVNEPLPSGYTLVSTTPSTGTYTAPNWAIGNLANGASATMTVEATVLATGVYANTVTIDGTEPDPDPTDNTDTETPTPTSTANLAITKSVNNATPTVGQNVIFTITATNNGPNNATGVIVNEPLPSGYTLVSTNTSVGSYTAPNWAIGNLANGASATMTVEATVLATGVYANTVTIDGTEPDPDPTDNTDTETPTPTPAPAPAIALVKTGVLSTDGNTITYTFTVRNTGNVILNPVVVNDPKLTPSNVTLLATTLAPGAETTGTATYTVTAAEKAAGQVQNTATATGTPPTGNPVTDVSGTEFTNNTPTVVAVPTADLSITKTASNLTPAIGSQITFTITATNNGPSNATGVVVNEPLPSGYTLVSATPSTGTYTAPNWTIGNLANGASATLTVTATVNATGSYANTVTIDGTEPDSDPTNNTDTETPVPTPAPAPAIALVKTGVLSTDGNTITYTFTVRNTGNVILNPVVVNDPKLTPSNVTLLATSLAPGAETTGTATYTVTVAEKAAGQVQNTATATGTPLTGNPVTDVSGTEFTNNTPTVVPVPTADLSITKTASNLTPAIGSQVTFTITATNNGPSNATGVVVNEPLPSGYTLVSATPSTGTYTAPNWTIGNLANGASATLTVVATVNATGSYGNTVTIDGTEPDPVPTNNTDTETVTPKKCPDGVNCLTAKVTKSK